MSDDEYLPIGLSIITSYEGGDQLQIQGTLYEIYSVEETARGLLFRMENDKQYLATELSQLRRGRKLKPKKPTVSR